MNVAAAVRTCCVSLDMEQLHQTQQPLYIHAEQQAARL